MNKKDWTYTVVLIVLVSAVASILSYKFAVGDVSLGPSIIRPGSASSTNQQVLQMLGKCNVITPHDFPTCTEECKGYGNAIAINTYFFLQYKSGLNINSFVYTWISPDLPYNELIEDVDNDARFLSDDEKAIAVDYEVGCKCCGGSQRGSTSDWLQITG